jgi:hypothetical protein
LLAALAAGCSGTLPEPVYANQVDEYFPEAGEGSADAQATREQAEACAARLNGHRSDAEVVTILQGIISGIGGAAGGVGGVLSAIDFQDPDLTTAMGVMSAVGAGVTLVGNLVIGLIANPQESARRQAEGRRSWDTAVELRYANGDPAAIREALERCTRDEPPPSRAAGAGQPFSR